MVRTDTSTTGKKCASSLCVRLSAMISNRSLQKDLELKAARICENDHKQRIHVVLCLIRRFKRCDIRNKCSSAMVEVISLLSSIKTKTTSQQLNKLPVTHALYCCIVVGACDFRNFTLVLLCCFKNVHL